MDDNSHIINSIVLKVVAPCNLNCSYCYEYNRGDSSWKSKPKQISDDVIESLGYRISRYCFSKNRSSFQINLHGGEPMMLGADGLMRVLTGLKRASAGIDLKFGMQTNATLVTADIVEILKSFNVKVGVSLDGDINANKNRLDHKGKESWHRTVKGLQILNENGLLSGIQAVINLDSDPVQVVDTLANFEPAIIEFSQPFGNHDNPPSDGMHRYTLSQWLISAFDHWVTNSKYSKIRMGILSDALVAIIGGRTNSEWFPSVPTGFIVVATDGAYEGLDALKVVGSEGRVLNLSCKDADIQDALNHNYLLLRSQGAPLCNECNQCSIKDWCRGGYLPTRYGNGNGFDNPSIYCGEIKNIFIHLSQWLISTGRFSNEDRNGIIRKVEILNNNGFKEIDDKSLH